MLEILFLFFNTLPSNVLKLEQAQGQRLVNGQGGADT